MDTNSFNAGMAGVLATATSVGISLLAGNGCNCAPKIVVITTYF